MSKKKLAIDIDSEQDFHVSSEGTFQQGDFAIGGGGLTQANAVMDSGIRPVEPKPALAIVEDSPAAAFAALDLTEKPAADATPPAAAAAAAAQTDAAIEDSMKVMAQDLDGGLKFDDLEKLKLLGAGASGQVWMVKDKNSEIVYALKQIPLEADGGKRKQLIIELKTMHQCNCPSIVTCFGLFYIESAFYIVLELMDAGSLFDILEKAPEKKISENIIAVVATQVSRALSYLHEQRRLIHRDIKPPNILVNLRGEFKVADFGVSGVLSASRSNCASWVGTVTYMSPERISGDKYGFRSDIWSMGLMLLECAVGRYPYISASTPPTLSFWDLLELITDNPAPKLPSEGFSTEFRQFVNACLSKDPKRRPTAADCLESPFVKKYTQTIDMAAWIKDALAVK